jgi:hypothetical protein
MATIANQRWISIRNIIIVAILNPKWPPKYENPPIWAKFGFQVDFDVGNWYPWFGSHIMIYFVGISTVVCCSFWGLATAAIVTKVQNGHQIQKSSDLGEIWFPSRLWCCELIPLPWKPQKHSI